MALMPGISYTGDLIDYIIDYSKDTSIVKKQLKNDDIDVFSGKGFDEKDKGFNLEFDELISIDSEKLQSAFNVDIDQNEMQKEISQSMQEISAAITSDTSPAKSKLSDSLNTLSDGLFKSINGTISLSDIDSTVGEYLNTQKAEKTFESLESEYVIPKDTFKTMYSGLLKGLLQTYINSYYSIDQSLTENPQNMTAVVSEDIAYSVSSSYMQSAAIDSTLETMAMAMTEANMKKEILSKVGELTGKLTSSFANAFNVDESKIAEAFKINIDEDEITRIVNAMMSNTETTAKTNLLSLGYQDKDEPTYISFYFNSFDGKENFMDFIDSYNEKMKEKGKEDKVINYTDTTGILMDSVKTIVNAVTYVLIAFISISLVVSSIMIGIITYISVYERTKEIGILRAIGASKRNISSIFNAETFIIGLLSGLFGIGTTYILIPIINAILHKYTGNIPLNAVFYVKNAVVLVILSVVLTLIGGLIPAKAASKKDPVIALRTE